MRRGDVAVAVVSWNTRELLRACLESLGPAREAGQAEVWVVDNGSTDGSREMVASEFEGVELLEPDENLGFGRAVNAIAAQTQADWVVAANADVAVSADTFDVLLEASARGDEVAMLAPRLVLPDGGTQHSVHPFPSLRMALAFNLGLTRLIPRLGDHLCIEGAWDSRRERSVDWAHGALLMIRRTAFEAVGGFDEKQWMYAEDLDLAWRVHRHGFRTRYVPGAPVNHALSASTSQAFGAEDARIERHVAATYRWMLRRRGRLRTAAFAAVNTLGAGVRLFLATVSPRRSARREDRHRYGIYMRVHSLGLRISFESEVEGASPLPIASQAKQ